MGIQEAMVTVVPAPLHSALLGLEKRHRLPGIQYCKLDGISTVNFLWRGSCPF